MDRNAFSTNTHADDVDVEDKKRFDSFRLGGFASRSANRRSAPVPHHVRSHSRQDSSVSSIPSTISLPHVTPVCLTDTPPTSPNGNASSKRSSHHRRRSSVSTRHESAEIMGVTLPSIPLSASDDNINLGDKDSIRRRALWTLEGKTDVGSFAKVEIPELNAGEIKKSFDFPTKPSYPPGIGAGFGSGLNSMMNSKRDSIGKFAPSTSNKEQLHTLVEEEEEEEEEVTVLDVTVTSSPVEEIYGPSLEPAATSVPSVPVRHRPASLNLRPLSLVSASALQGELPTPSPSPNVPVPRSGLKALTLATPPSVSECVASVVPKSADASWKRRSSVFVPSSAPPAAARLLSLNTSGIQVPPPVAPVTTRRSSISYYSSGSPPDVPAYGLPTPEMTPVSDRRLSSASTESDASRHSSRVSRPLSVSEQHFLFQAHQTLVQRISDLERALSARPRSRPQSSASDVSFQSEAVSDEMLQLVADLKTERDELKRDVDGWRNRFADSEKQMTLLFRRVENERREAWVARERVGLMDVEKRALEKTLQEQTIRGEEGWQKFRDAENQLAVVRAECEVLRGEARETARDREEYAQLKILLDAEVRKREELERELEGLLATPTPRAFEINKPTTIASRTMMFAKRGGLGFRSIDSAGSFTDVESVGSIDYGKINLKAVEEEDEDDNREDAMSECSAEDNGLVGYEDEEDNDHYASHELSSSSSMGSADDFASSTTSGANASSDSMPPLSLSRSSTASPALPASPPQTSAHNRHRSLSNAWTFPQDTGNYSTSVARGDDVDRFFNCLEDLDGSPPLVSLENGKTSFAQALADGDGDLPPFLLPSGFGVEVSPPLESKTVLEVLFEEEEEEEDSVDEDSVDADGEFIGEEVEGGIIFTFNPPPSLNESESPRELSELSQDSVHTPDTSFTEDHGNSFSSTSSVTSSSSIPRLVTSRKSMLPVSFPTSSTPVKNSHIMDGLQSPPSASSTPLKQGSSPSSPIGMRRSISPSTPSKLPQPSFIPHPRRVVPTKAGPIVSSKGTVSPKQPPSMFDDTFSPGSSSTPEVSDDDTVRPADASTAPRPVPSSSFMSPATLPLSIQKLTSLVPLSTFASWSSLSPQSAPPSPLQKASQSISDLSSGPSHSKFISRETQLQKLRIRLIQEKENQRLACFEPTAIRNIRDAVLHL